MSLLISYLLLKCTQFYSENEKLSQREILWQQVESLAKTKADCAKAAGMLCAGNSSAPSHWKKEIY